MLAVGADLKNTVTLVVDGQAFVSQHIGDLDHYQAYQAFQETIRDLASMYEVDLGRSAGGPRCHPQYARRRTRWNLRGRQKHRSAASSRAHRFGARRARSVGQAGAGRQL